MRMLHFVFSFSFSFSFSFFSHFITSVQENRMNNVTYTHSHVMISFGYCLLVVAMDPAPAIAILSSTAGILYCTDEVCVILHCYVLCTLDAVIMH